MSSSPAPGVRLGRPLVGVLVLLVLAQLVFAISIRLPYPFALEWMEGGMLEHVRRLSLGLPLFTPPSVEFVPYIYAPLYYYLGALGAEAWGLSLPMLRALSVGCTVGTFGLLFWGSTRRLRGQPWRVQTFVGLVTVGLFAATWPLSGTFFDLARVDMLFVLLTLGGTLALLEGTRLSSGGLAGMLLGLAFLSKQSALPWCGPLLALELWQHPRRALVALLTLGLVGGGGSLLCAAGQQEWYVYYLFTLPGSHPLDWSLSSQLWSSDLLVPLWPSLGVIGLSLWRLPDTRRQTRGELVLLLGALLTAWGSRVHVGGYDNVVLPLHVTVCLLAGRALARLSETPSDEKSPSLSRREGLALGLLGLNLLLLFRDVSPLLPQEVDRHAGEELVKQLEAVPGAVWVPGHSELSLAAGKAAGAHWMALEDVLRGVPGPAREGLIQSLRLAFQSQQFEAILLNGAPPKRMLETYELKGPVFAQPELFRTVTGLRTRPESWWIRRAPPAEAVSPADEETEEKRSR